MTLTKRLVILQCGYLPWKGFFDLMELADEFVILDAQYTKRDIRNRNKIKTPRGPEWLTVPVEVSGKYTQLVSETKIADPFWARRHLHALEANYGKAPYFRDYIEQLRDLYNRRWVWLEEMNLAFISLLASFLGVTTPVKHSKDYPSRLTKTDRLVDICLQAGATSYLSGPKAKSYLDESKFPFPVEWMSYEYPEYPQLHPPFDHGVTVLDLLFNVGPDSNQYMRTYAHHLRGRRVC